MSSEAAMAAATAHAPARAIFFLVDLLPNLRSSTIESVGPCSGAVKRAERSMTRCFGTGYSGRLPRFACFARHRQTSTRPNVFPRDLVSEQKHNRWTGRLRKG